MERFSTLDTVLSTKKIQNCFVDTTVLFAVTYPSDRFNDASVEAFGHLSDFGIPAFTNVNVRAEFLENHRRVLIAECLIDFYEDMESDLDGVLAEKLKRHRTSHRRKVAEGKSAKMDVHEIKTYRRLLADYGSEKMDGWETFCRMYLRSKLAPLWAEAQKELDLNFISLRSEDNSPYLNEIPEWETTVDLMGCYGLSSADAMIINMFLCSKIPILLTADAEMASCALREGEGLKRVFVPDSLNLDDV